MSYSEAMAKHYYLKEFADKLDSKKPDTIAIQHAPTSSFGTKKISRLS